MPYATYADLQGEYGDADLLNCIKSSSVTPEAVWTRRLVAASAYIDTFIQKQGYPIPINFGSLDPAVAESLGALLAGWCMALAMEVGGASVIAVPEGQKTIAQHARDDLKRVASGDLRLPLGIGNEIIASAPGFFERSGDDPLVSLDQRLFDMALNPWLS